MTAVYKIKGWFVPHCFFCYHTLDVLVYCGFGVEKMTNHMSWYIFLSSKTCPETYRYTLKTFIVQDTRITKTQQRPISDTILHDPSYNYISNIKK